MHDKNLQEKNILSSNYPEPDIPVDVAWAAMRKMLDEDISQPAGGSPFGGEKGRAYMIVFLILLLISSVFVIWNKSMKEDQSGDKTESQKKDKLLSPGSIVKLDKSINPDTFSIVWIKNSENLPIIKVDSLLKKANKQLGGKNINSVTDFKSSGNSNKEQFIIYSALKRNATNGKISNHTNLGSISTAKSQKSNGDMQENNLGALDGILSKNVKQQMGKANVITTSSHPAENIQIPLIVISKENNNSEKTRIIRNTIETVANEEMVNKITQNNLNVNGNKKNNKYFTLTVREDSKKYYNGKDLTVDGKNRNKSKTNNYESESEVSADEIKIDKVKKKHKANVLSSDSLTADRFGTDDLTFNRFENLAVSNLSDNGKIYSTSNQIIKKVRDSLSFSDSAKLNNNRKLRSRARFHFALQWNADLPLHGFKDYFKGASGNFQPYTYFIPGIIFSKVLGKRNEGIVSFYPYQQYHFGNKLIDSKTGINYSGNPLDSNMVLTTTQLRKSFGMGIGIQYNYRINDRLVIGVGTALNWQNNALVNQRVTILSNAQVLLDSYYKVKISATTRDSSYLKSTFFTGRAELSYRISKIQIGGTLSIPITNVGYFSYKPISGQLFLRLRIK